MDALSSAEASLTRLRELVQAAALAASTEMEACLGRLDAEKGALEEARARLEAALVGDVAAWEQARQAAPEFGESTL